MPDDEQTAPVVMSSLSSTPSSSSTSVPAPERIDTSLKTGSLEKRLSIVLVTSPVAAHPDTRLVDDVIRSFDLVEGLEGCELIIIGDGVKEVEDVKKQKWKQGFVLPDVVGRYDEYMERLRRKYELGKPCGIDGRPLEDGVRPEAMEKLKLGVGDGLDEETEGGTTTATEDVGSESEVL